MQSDRHLMLVTEYCSGGEIFDQLVSNGRMTESKACSYFIQIIKAVKYLHEHGIVHRDLKAENLLLSADHKTVKLADFGFSNYFTKDNLLSTWCGSPPYAAPELFEGKQYCGPKADIWSLGVVLYVLVCGALPFDGNTLHSLKTRVLSGKFRIPIFMSFDCENLIRHMLLIDPEKRYTLKQVLQHKWIRSLGSKQLSETLSEELQDIHISLKSCPPLDETIDMTIVERIAIQFSLDNSEILESVESRLFDQYYALYHLLSDSSQTPSISAPHSPPLLPIIPSTNQRKSSITTGIVEREPSTSLNPNVSSFRRHTFGPESNNPDNCNSQNQLVTPPLLFLTPPIMAGASGLPFPISNLPFAPPNYPITNMDLLRPPPVLLMANNNMGRRASDGQANYANNHMEVSQGPSTSSSSYNCSGKLISHNSPQMSYFKKKRHSLTDSNDITSRQKRIGLASLAFPNNAIDRFVSFVSFQLILISIFEQIQKTSIGRLWTTVVRRIP